MENEVAIIIEGVTKTYEIGVKKSDSLRNSFNKFLSKKSTKPTFNALENITLQLRRGEVLGVIGKNGAGKSTLLKVLSKITKPTKGRIEINGRVASLLEVGTGFHPELTGRENIYLNGTILGMTRKEVARKLDEIIAFSNVGKFIDTPVKHYSSGMYVRLAFSVAAHLEPEILIIDEVLAVGDADFQKKSLGKMEDVANDGRTVVFVSHNLTAVNNLCTKAIVLDKGSLVFSGEPNHAIQYYYKQSKGSNSTWEVDLDTTKTLQFKKVTISNFSEANKNIITVSVVFYAHSEFPKSFVAFYIQSRDSQPVAESIPNYKPFVEFTNKGEFSLSFELDLSNFIPNLYTFGMWIGPTHSDTLDFYLEMLDFELTKMPVLSRTIPYPRHAGHVVFESKAI